MSFNYDGRPFRTVSNTEGGRYRLHESWRRPTGDLPSGTPVVEEFRADD